MHYETQYEICALLFLVILTVRFFGVRQFPSRENRIFGIILNCAVADLVLDIIGAYTIHHDDGKENFDPRRSEAV